MKGFSASIFPSSQIFLLPLFSFLYNYNCQSLASVQLHTLPYIQFHKCISSAKSNLVAVTMFFKNHFRSVVVLLRSVLFISCPHMHLCMPLLSVIDNNSFYGITIKNYIKWNWFQSIMFKTNIIPSLLYLNYPKTVEMICCHEYLFRDANIQNNARIQFTVEV